MAFMPFVTCGDPDMQTTLSVVRELAARGVDLIEIGFPYSDPIADGPTIQASYTRALEKKLHTGDIFAAIESLDTNALPPLVAMVSYAIVFRNSPQAFVRRLTKAGFRGLIVPDLPGDEAGDLAPIARMHDVELVQLVAPTTPENRIETILKASAGFVYCISVAGTTGVRDTLPQALVEQLNDLRRRTSLPLAVGFGISRPRQVDGLRGLADGVIVGSAIVRRLESLSDGSQTEADVLRSIGDFAGEMVAAAHR
jgi:tryptophan synthase alpha chain